MRTSFVDELCRIAAFDERVWLLTGDLGFSVLEPFRDKFPDRFVNMGVAEQNMTGVAAGLALSGKIVFTYSIANFPVMRCLEQIRNDVCHHRLDVKIVAVGGGVAYGAQGYTHHGVEDLAVMRALPDMAVLAPGDPIEAGLATRRVVGHAGPCYLRLGTSGDPLVHDRVPHFKIGRAIEVRGGDDLALVSTGTMLATAVEVADRLAVAGISARVLSMHTVQPLDVGSLRAAARETGLLATIEPHSAIGGLHSAVLEALAPEPVRCLRFSLPADGGRVVGSASYMMSDAGLDPLDICSTILAEIDHPRESQRLRQGAA